MEAFLDSKFLENIRHSQNNYRELIRNFVNEGAECFETEITDRPLNGVSFHVVLWKHLLGRD
jgi:hypothetical protein